MNDEENLLKNASIANAKNVKRDKNPNVVMRSEIASFFFPSRYQRIGRPKTRRPVVEADNTKSRSIAIGMRTVSLVPPKS